MKKIKKERPISFSVDMVLAILKGWKTQTSRMRGLERFNEFPNLGVNLWGDEWRIEYFAEEEPGHWLAISNDESGEFPAGFDPCIKCPYGKTGDRLWVREPWKVGDFAQDPARVRVHYMATKSTPLECAPLPESILTRLIKQSIEDCQKTGIPSWMEDSNAFRPRRAIFMPRAASRILLEITDVQLKRLKEIEWYEAEDEGIEQTFYNEETSLSGWRNYLDPEMECIRSKDSFFTLWDHIYGAGAAEKNPWVWMIQFKVLEIKK